MIINKKIKIKVRSNTIKLYKKKYDCNVGDLIEIEPDELSKSSTIIVECECDVCGKIKETQYRHYLRNINNKGFYTCSLSCSQVKIKLTKLENHGDENYSGIEKRKETCLEKYNDENYKNVEKRIETNLEKYGVEHVIQNEEIQEKRKEAWIKKYGVDHPMKVKEIQEKRKETNFIRHNNKNYNNIIQTLKTIKVKNLISVSKKFDINAIDYDNKIFKVKCNKCNNIYETNYDLISKRSVYGNEQCTICNKIGVHYSNREKQLYDFITENYSGIIIGNSRKIINPFEIDIYLPELKIAYEFNGLYWHSETYRDKSYHKMKYDLCEEKGIQLIHVWEDDWNYKQEIVKSMILNKIGKTKNKVFARNTVVRNVSNNETKNFLEKNHIQSSTNSSVRIGLYYNDELVSLMTFIKKNQNGDFELNRFCNKLNMSIVGGASKLFKHFTKNYNFKDIISFSNNSYSNGNLYEQLKFKKDKELKEDYSYILNGKRFHKFNFRKQEKERKTLLKIYDSGKIKFIYS